MWYRDVMLRWLQLLGCCSASRLEMAGNLFGVEIYFAFWPRRWLVCLPWLELLLPPSQPPWRSFLPLGMGYRSCLPA